MELIEKIIRHSRAGGNPSSTVLKPSLRQGSIASSLRGNDRLLIFPPKYWFYGFLFIHLIAWTLIPYTIRFALPRDAMEGLLWGQQLQWGYDKDPFFYGWVSWLAQQCKPYTELLIYFFSQLCVTTGLWAIWKLSKKMLPAIYALIAVLILEGVQYYNLHAIDFSDNTLELALWSLTILFFYKALKQSNFAHWILTGLFAGFSMMTKYYSCMLIASLFLFFILFSENRKYLKTLAPYAGLGVFILVISPHIIWLCSHDFLTVDYALQRIANIPSWSNHFYFPLKFSEQQILAFFPGFLLLLVFFPFSRVNKIHLASFDKHFLLFAGLGPFALTILLSLFTGIKLRSGWGEPLLSLWGVLVITYLPLQINARRFYFFISLFFILFNVLLLSYALALIRAEEPSSANFPGKEIAKIISAEWQREFHQPLHYIAGPRWLAGNIALYSSDHPSVLIDWNKKISPWIQENQLLRQGGVFIWDLAELGALTPNSIQLQFPHMRNFHILRIKWLRNNKITPIEIGIAFLPPWHLK